MNKLAITTLLLVLISPFNAYANNTVDHRGSTILNQQLERARHLKELEYQADVLERQSRIAKAQQQIDKTIGLEDVKHGASSVRVSSLKANPHTHEPLPKIIELTRSNATFEFHDGAVAIFSVGQTLPSGYIVDSISMVNGVVLLKDQARYQLNLQW